MVVWKVQHEFRQHEKTWSLDDMGYDQRRADQSHADETQLTNQLTSLLTETLQMCVIVVPLTGRQSCSRPNSSQGPNFQKILGKILSFA